MCYCLKFELPQTCFEPYLAQVNPTLLAATEPPFHTSNLNRLPPEIIVQISKSLDNHKSLNSLARVNSRFKTLLTPVIYAEFDTAYNKETHFLRTLISAPHLSHHVKRLRWMDERDDWDSDKDAYEVENRQVIASELSKSPSIFHKQLAAAIKHAIGGTLHVALLAAALSLAPNLELLELTLASRTTSRIRWNEAVWIASPHSFGHLHTIKVKLQRKAGMDLNVLFLLPTVRTLDITTVSRGKSDQQKSMWLPLPEKSSNVETLLLRKSSIYVDILVAAVKSCKALKKFLYQHHDIWVPLRNLDMTQLSSALILHKETLRELGIMERLGEREETTPVPNEIVELPRLENVLLPIYSTCLKTKDRMNLGPEVRRYACTIKGTESRKAFDGFLRLLSRDISKLKEESPLLETVTVWVVEREYTSSLVVYVAKSECRKAGVTLNVNVLSDKSDVSTAVDSWESGVFEA